MNGFALGGAATGFNEFQQTANQTNQVANTAKYQQGLLQIQQQAQKNQQQRELFARADKNASELMGIVSQTIQNAAITAAQNGQPLDVGKITKAVSPLVEQAKRLKTSSGGDGSVIDAMINAQFASLQSSINPPPKSEPKNLTIASPSGSGEPAPPGQNITSGTVTGVDYGPIETSGPNGQPVASPASSPTQPANPYDIRKITNVLSVLPKDDPRRPMLMEQYKEALRIQNQSVDPLQIAKVKEAQMHTASMEEQTREREAVKQTPDLKTADPVMKFQAEALLNGNTQVLAGMGFSQTAGSYKIQIYRLAAQMAIEKGVTPEQYNTNVAQFMGTKAGATVVGRLQAMTIAASTKAAMTGERVTEISARINRTEYPTLNSLLLAAEKGTGNTDVVRLGIAVNTFVNNYALAMGNGRSYATDSARKEGFALLNQAWSKGQISAGVDQMLNKELPSEVLGAGMSMKNFLNPAGTFQAAEESLSGKKPSPAPSDSGTKKHTFWTDY